MDPPVSASLSSRPWPRPWRGWPQPASLVASDFDGTVALLVEDPARARALPGAETALIRLAGVAAHDGGPLSGRSLASLRAGVGPPRRSRHPVGGHGIEREDERPRRKRPRPRLRSPAGSTTPSRTSLVRGSSESRSASSSTSGPSKPRSARACCHRVHMGEDSGLHLLEGHAVMEALVRPPAKGQASSGYGPHREPTPSSTSATT